LAKPVVRWSDGNISPTKALNGSIEILIEASIIQSVPAAIQRTGEFGIKIKAREARIAPVRKYGRRRPSLFQVLSLICPIMGWIINPVTGAAIHKIGMFSTLAPEFQKSC